MNPKTLSLLPFLLVPLSFLGACASLPPEVKLERMYADLHAELNGRRIGPSEDVEGWERQEERLKEVRELRATGKLVSARDHLYAAVILVETNSEEDLVAAHELGLRAAELAEDKGLRVAAEAQDRLCVKHKVAQKYGTQFVYQPVLKAWRLYPVDPNTSDAERAAMGVEPMERLRAREAELNRATGGKPNGSG